MTQATPGRVVGEPGVEDRPEVRGGAVQDGDAAAADRRRHVGVGQHRADDGLRLGHDLDRRPVVDAERCQADPVEPDARQAFLPRLGEPVPGLGAVSDDGEAARGAPQQQHLPLGVGQLLRLVHDDVRERSGEQVGIASRESGLVDQRALQVVDAQHRHEVHLGVVGLDEMVDDLRHLLPLRRQGRVTPAPASRRLRVTEPLPGRVEERQVGDSPGLRVLALQGPDLVDLEPRCASAQVGGYRPQVGHQVGGLDDGPGGVEGGQQLRVLGERPPKWLRWDLLVLVLVDEDRDQLLEDVVPGLVVRCPRR